MSLVLVCIFFLSHLVSFPVNTILFLLGSFLLQLKEVLAVQMMELTSLHVLGKCFMPQLHLYLRLEVFFPSLLKGSHLNNSSLLTVKTLSSEFHASQMLLSYLVFHILIFIVINVKFSDICCFQTHL